MTIIVYGRAIFKVTPTMKPTTGPKRLQHSGVKNVSSVKSKLLLGYILIGQHHINRSTLNPTRYDSYLAGSSEVQHQQCYTSLDSAR